MMVDVKYICVYFDDFVFDGCDNQVVDQIVCVDCIVINKVDFVDVMDVGVLIVWLCELNSIVEIVMLSYVQVDFDCIFGIGVNEFVQIFVESDGLVVEVLYVDEYEYMYVYGYDVYGDYLYDDYDDYYEYDVSVLLVGIEVDVDVDFDVFEVWFGELCCVDIVNLFWMKGIFVVQGCVQCYVLQGVYGVIELCVVQVWGCELCLLCIVFIGCDFDCVVLIDCFYVCFVVLVVV